MVLMCDAHRCPTALSLMASTVRWVQELGCALGTVQLLHHMYWLANQKHYFCSYFLCRLWRNCAQCAETSVYAVQVDEVYECLGSRHSGDARGVDEGRTMDINQKKGSGSLMNYHSIPFIFAFNYLMYIIIHFI